VRIARVFPRRTKASPDDDLAFFGPPGLFPPDVDEVHVSVTFTWDIQEAERLAQEWERVAPVKIGGPALGDPGGDFVPGKYLRRGYVITSRGCPGRCSVCLAWRREGGIREVNIADGWVVQDNNLLACSEDHVRKVFRMLSRQKYAAVLSGGLEASRIELWHVDLLARSRIDQVFFAYDSPADLEPLRKAGAMLRDAGMKPKKRFCYVLIGLPGDNLKRAEERCLDVVRAGFMPFAMLYRDTTGKRERAWAAFARQWSRPAAIVTTLKKSGIELI